MYWTHIGLELDYRIWCYYLFSRYILALYSSTHLLGAASKTLLPKMISVETVDVFINGPM